MYVSLMSLLALRRMPLMNIKTHECGHRKLMSLLALRRMPLMNIKTHECGHSNTTLIPHKIYPPAFFLYEIIILVEKNAPLWPLNITAELILFQFWVPLGN